MGGEVKMRTACTVAVSTLLASSLSWGQIPKSYFGMHNQGYRNWPLHSSYGSYRIWDASGSPGSQWSEVHTCASPHTASQCQADPTLTTLTWTTLDAYLSGIKSQAGAGAQVLYTLSRTPAWASAGTTDTNCRYSGAETASCYPPVNLNQDGSGSNNIWDYWVTQIATHVKNTSADAQITTWEPWNEFGASPTLGYGYSSTNAASYKGTWAQLLRMTEDLRCIIKGVGTIHNYPSSGSSTACATYLAALPSWSSHAAINSSALISTPSGSPDPQYPAVLRAEQNFLYCNHSPTNDVPLGSPSSTSCTWSGGASWGSAAVDVINFHFYENGAGYTPETVGAWVSTIESSGYLSSADQAKPLISGEGSDIESGSGVGGSPVFGASDPYAEMGAVARFMALYWSYGISQIYWYAYNLYSVLWNGSALTQPGTAWNTAYGWLVGSTPVNAPFCSTVGTVYTCALKEANGKPAELVWDSKFGPGGNTAPSVCSTYANPIICGNESYTVPGTYSADWIDLNGTSHAFSPAVTIGAVPILLEGGGNVPATGPVKMTGNVRLTGQILIKSP